MKEKEQKIIVPQTIFFLSYPLILISTYIQNIFTIFLHYLTITYCGNKNQNQEISLQFPKNELAVPQGTLSGFEFGRPCP